MRANGSEVAILLIVSLMAFLANVQIDGIDHFIDQKLLLMGLAATVIISLFRYLRLMLFITVSILAIGANLPEHLANELQISQPALIVASCVLVVIGVWFKFFHIGTGFYRAPRDGGVQIPIEEDIVPTWRDTLATRRSILTAIMEGNLAALHQLLMSGVEINFSQNGLIPLFLAIEKGYADILMLLLSYGATTRVKNKEDLSPLEFAQLHADERILDILQYASQQNLAVQNRGAVPIRRRSQVVVMFADICGSTALYDRLGNEVALDVISRTLDILSQEVKKHNGSVIKTIGDELMCSFSSVELAMEAACAMNHALDMHRPGKEFPVYVRVGLHCGDVIQKGDDLFGDTVNIAARVRAITKARQVMTTQTVVDTLPAYYSDKVRPVMRSIFQGKRDSFAVFEILWSPEETSAITLGNLFTRKPRKEKIVAVNDPFSSTMSLQTFKPEDAHAAHYPEKNTHPFQ